MDLTFADPSQRQSFPSPSSVVPKRNLEVQDTEFGQPKKPKLLPTDQINKIQDFEIQTDSSHSNNSTLNSNGFHECSEDTETKSFEFPEINFNTGSFFAKDFLSIVVVGSFVSIFLYNLLIVGFRSSF
jgi:hypothetical protein